jgi:PAS domain S-box-containing protein
MEQEILAEKAKMEELNRLTLMAINDGIWDWDISNNTIKYSKRWKEMLGYSDDDISDDATAWMKIIDSEDLQKVMALLDEHFKNDIPFTHISKYTHKNGKIRKLMCRSSTVRDQNNHPMRMLSSFTDVTDFEATHQKLDESSSRLGLTLEVSQLGTWDYSFVETKLNVDKLFFKLIGFPETASIIDTFDIVYEGKMENFLHEIKNQGSLSDHIKFTNTIKRGDGELRVFKFEAKVFYNNNGEMVQALGICKDETDDRNSEVLMQHQSKMASLGEMAGGMAHEINNPLSIICGYAEKLAGLTPEDITSHEEIVFIGRKIEKTAERISKIIKGLKSFSRQGEDDPFELVSVRKVIDETFVKHD